MKIKTNVENQKHIDNQIESLKIQIIIQNHRNNSRIIERLQTQVKSWQRIGNEKSKNYREMFLELTLINSGLIWKMLIFFNKSGDNL